MVVPTYIPTNSVRRFPFLHTLSSIYYNRFFDDGHSDWCEVVSHCSFELCSTIALISHTSKVMLKILQARLQQYVNHELPVVQAGFIKGRGTRDQIANIC